MLKFFGAVCAVSLLAITPQLCGKTWIKIADETPWGTGGWWPTVTKLANGEIFVLFNASTGHKANRLVYTKSTDNGKTWSKPKLFIEGPEGYLDAAGMITQLSDGTLVAWHDRRNREGKGEIWVSRSEDNGATWTTPKKIMPKEDFDPFPKGYDYRPYPFGRMLELADGTIIMSIYGELYRGPPVFAGLRHFTGLICSRDKGKTWGDYTLISYEHNHCEPSIVQLKDGRLLCMMRPCMCQSFSSDNGKTWSKPEYIGHRGDAPDLLLTSEGVLLCAHRHPKTAVSVSMDNGKTWGEPQVIDSECIGAYASMVELDDGRILIVYYEETLPDSDIRAAFFRVKDSTIELEELD